MISNPKTINTTNWTAITTAGQQGAVQVLDNVRGNGGVLISHSSTGVAPVSRYGFRLRLSKSNVGMMILGRDNANDVFYARCTKANNVVRLLVDVI